MDCAAARAWYLTQAAVEDIKQYAEALPALVNIGMQIRPTGRMTAAHPSR
ncbi:hypothetical protein [Dentiradicibacter hellwigii]|uniref:Uncharacterized protein n=1 Tax=Dentiradicibacter hellwigii TaxID=3149053 RepID=A0ABV4UHQ2_9RHOO